MKSEWRVTYNPMLPETPYGVYRLRDIDAVNHSGNRQNHGEYFAERSEAEDLAERLNREETNAGNERL